MYIIAFIFVNFEEKIILILIFECKFLKKYLLNLYSSLGDSFVTVKFIYHILTLVVYLVRSWRFTRRMGS